MCLGLTADASFSVGKRYAGRSLKRSNCGLPQWHRCLGQTADASLSVGGGGQSKEQTAVS